VDSLSLDDLCLGYKATTLVPLASLTPFNMSIFSSIRKSRQSAKEHSAKIAEQQKKESEAVPYKHVPTHAALDAIASAPPSWREQDRDRIVEQNRRRSALPTQVHHASMPSIPRVGSSLSHVSYPADYASPVVRGSGHGFDRPNRIEIPLLSIPRCLTIWLSLAATTSNSGPRAYQVCTRSN
jgi:hypothetical protein